MPPLSRRQLLRDGTFGVGSVALAYLLNRERLLAEPPKPDLEARHFDLKPKPPHFAPKAKAMISLFMQGGPSHVDLLDPKPKLTELDGQPFPGTIKYDNAAQASSKVLGSPWKFAKRGQCGTEVSELLPHLADIIDDVTVVRSMHTDVNNHVQSIHALNTGRIRRRAPGRWGAGCATASAASRRNCPRSSRCRTRSACRSSGVEHWSNGWLPSLYQGTVDPAARAAHPQPRPAAAPQGRAAGGVT